VVVNPPELTHRQRQAAATKAQVAASARALFAERGYVATTISAISEGAAIPVQTIYSAFGTKANILREIAMEAVATIDVDQRHTEAAAQADPAKGLRLAAALQRDQFEVMYDVISVYQEAARTDPEVQAAMERILSNRRHAFRRHLEAIAPNLASGVNVDTGLAIYVALVVSEIWRTLVIEHGWTPDRYEQWLADALVHHLLGARRTRSRGAHE
jgi:AcrR family transcriptional regulator